ncbi:MAG: hypothetical protein HRT45_07080 [Bdellovibrionales bacterium]|nr:hypothetical protein [Bdellovibrionales bacterium]
MESMRTKLAENQSLRLPKMVTLLLAVFCVISLTGAGGPDRPDNHDPYEEYHSIGDVTLPFRMSSFAAKFRLKRFSPRIYNQETEHPPLWSTHWAEILTVNLLMTRKDSGACKPLSRRRSQLWVVEYTGSGESAYENIRNENRQVQSVIPVGSLVLVHNPEDIADDVYVPVRVVSRAPFRPDRAVDEYAEDEPLTMDNKPVADWRERGFIYGSSLKPIQNYFIDLGENDYTEHAIKNGYDFSNHVFMAQVDPLGREQSLECVNNTRGTSFTEYKLFSLIDLDTEKSVNEIAISMNDPALLYSASAVRLDSEHMRDPIRQEEQERESMIEAFWRGSAELLDYLDEKEQPEAYEAEERRLENQELLRDNFSAFVDVPGVDVFDGPQQFLACTLHDDLNVRDLEGNRVGTLPPNSPIRLLQNYQGDPTYLYDSGGEEHPMYHIQGLDADGQMITGYATSDIVKSRQDCQAVHEARREFLARFRLPGPIESIDDDNCCVYPLLEPHENTFVPGDGTRFGAGRSRGGTHPGCDMEGDLEDPIMAVAPGIIKHLNRGYTDVNTRYPSDCAVAVTHINSRGEGIFEADYAEVYCNIFNHDGTRPRANWSGARIEDGEQFLKIGNNTHSSRHMLHLELYDKVRIGAATPAASYSSIMLGNTRGRRSDLRNCNKDIEKWFRMYWPGEDI